MSDNIKISGSRSFFFTWRLEDNENPRSSSTVYFYNDGGNTLPRRRFTGVDMLVYLKDNSIGSSYERITKLNKYYEWDATFLIEGIRCSFFLANSLPLADIAPIEVYDDSSTKILKYNEMQKKDTMSIEIHEVSRDVYNPNSSPASFFNTVSAFIRSIKIQNVGRPIEMDLLQPYLVTDASPLSLSLYQGLGFKLRNDGYGLLGRGDFVNIGITAKYLITGFPKKNFDTGIRNLSISVSHDRWSGVVPFQEDRLKISLTNQSEADITLYFTLPGQDDPNSLYSGQPKSVWSGVVLKPGGSWNDEGIAMLKHEIWARSHEGTGLLTGVVAVVAEQNYIL